MPFIDCCETFLNVTYIALFDHNSIYKMEFCSLAVLDEIGPNIFGTRLSNLKSGRIGNLMSEVMPNKTLNLIFSHHANLT